MLSKIRYLIKKNKR